MKKTHPIGVRFFDPKEKSLKENLKGIVFSL